MARKRFNLPSLLAVTSLLLICVSTPLTPSVRSAQTFTENVRTPIAGTVSDCSGNPVTITGELHILTHTTVSDSGHVSSVFHLNQNLQGVSADGTRHVMNQQVQETQTIDSTDGFPSTYTFVIHSNLNNSDPNVPQLRVRGLVHVTFNANGEITGVQVEVKEECQG